MLNLSYIATFIKVAELGSFNKAADELYLSPNSVMNQINVLEDELGNVKLMRRNKRGIELTSVGKVFYTEAKEIMSRCDEAKKKVRVAAYNSNTVKLVTYHSMPLDIFGNIWSKAKEKFPELNVEMVLYDGSKDAHLR
ncbi:MAG: LysR family transcriptional regulator, partial [Firmicutes bacterium]|nr:LysR family transcriptional regulator [Bacillota bacterium]